MATEHDATEILSRFNTEQEYIKRYVDYLQVKTAIDDDQIQWMRDVLQQVGLPILPMMGVHPREHYSRAEIERLLDSKHFPGSRASDQGPAGTTRPTAHHHAHWSERRAS
jgi:hypothetical protein